MTRCAMKNLVRALRAMADEPRMTILSVLSIRGAVCVSHLQEAMKTPQPTVSRYLSILRNAGLLESERRGQWVYYSLNHDDSSLVMEMIQRASEQLRDSAKIKRIMERLDKLEQQPPLTEEPVLAKAKSKPRGMKRVYKRQEGAASEAIEEEDVTTGTADTAALREAATQQAAEPAVGTDADAFEQPFEAPAEPTVPDDGIETVEKAQTEQGLEADGKKRARKKKQQLPSLFDL